MGHHLWGECMVRCVGSCTHQSLGDKSYMLTFTDEELGKTVDYFIAKKSDVFKNYKNYEAWVKKHKNKDGIKNLHSDCTGNYLSKEFVVHLKSQGTHHE